MQRILVVDDVAAYRELTCAVLRLEGFEAMPAATAGQTLRLARECNPDLILLDLGLPDGDGLDCLEKIRKQPRLSRTPVIIMTGNSDRSHVRRAAQLNANGYILKDSFSPKRFFEQVRAALAIEPTRSALKLEKDSHPPQLRIAHGPAVDAAEELDAEADYADLPNLDHDQVLARIHSEIELKAVPPVLQYVLQLTNSRQTSLKDIAVVIRNDHALALKVLHVANCSSNGGSYRARTICEAAQRIGMVGIRNIATAILMMENFSATAEGGLNMQDFWEHSLATAILSQGIGEELKMPNQDALYLAGLFHDLGRLLLSNLYPTRYAPLLKSVENDNEDLRTVEKRCFGLSQSEVTRRVLQRWNCGEALIDAIPMHQGPPENGAGREKKAAQVIALADSIAHARLFGNNGDSVLLPVHSLAREIDLSNEKLSQISKKAVARTEETQLLLESASQNSTGIRFAESLRDRLPKDLRATVFCEGAPDDEFTMWAQALNIHADENPNVALIRSRSYAEGCRHMAALQEQEAALGHPLPLILLLDKADPSDATAAFRGREFTEVQAPFWYGRIIAALNNVAAATKSRELQLVN